MAGDDRLAVKFDAFSVGMRAQAGGLDATDVDNLVTRAEQLLGSADQLTRAVTGFATQYQIARYDAPELARLGRTLVAYIDALNMPTPPGQDRRDIHG